jgi:predicted transcriptional regulator
MDRPPGPEAPVTSQPAWVGVVTGDVLAKLSDTEKQVLQLLVEGPKSAPEIGRLTGKSREHTARVMKALFEQRFVERETYRQPYEYRLNDKVRGVLIQNVEAPTECEQQT